MVVTNTDIENAQAKYSNRLYALAKKRARFFEQGKPLCDDYWDEVINLSILGDSLTRAKENIQSGCLTSSQVWDIINKVNAQ